MHPSDSSNIPIKPSIQSFNISIRFLITSISPSHTSSTVSSYTHTWLRPPAFLLFRFFRGYFDPLIYIYPYFLFIYFDIFSLLFCFFLCFPFLSVFFSPFFYHSPFLIVFYLHLLPIILNVFLSFPLGPLFLPFCVCFLPFRGV